MVHVQRSDGGSSLSDVVVTQNLGSTGSPTPEELQHALMLRLGCDTVRFSKGKYLAGGVSGIVKLLPNGYVIKSPWNGHWEEKECQEDMARKASVYQRLSEYFGQHERFIKVISYDKQEYAITMERMLNGTLRDYLKANSNQISRTQRHHWILALAEGMQMLHAANIIHCDFSPRNMLLDEALVLKVADFGCVSIDGCKSTAGGSMRFYHPRVRSREKFEFSDDLFALGSSIYEVLTGKPPYADLETRPVYADLEFRPIQDLYRLQQFPDLADVGMRDIILDCWLYRAQSAGVVYQRISEKVSASGTTRAQPSHTVDLSV